MMRVNIAKFKSHLSYFLNRVRNGEQVIVTDRKTPIAQVIPYGGTLEKLTIIPAKQSPRMLKKLKIPPAPPGTDSLKALLEDRADDLENWIK